MGNSSRPFSPNKPKDNLRESILIRSYKTKHSLKDSFMTAPDRNKTPGKRYEEDNHFQKFTEKLDQVFNKLTYIELRVKELEKKNTEKILFNDDHETPSKSEEPKSEILLEKRSVVNTQHETKPISATELLKTSNLDFARARMKLSKIEQNSLIFLKKKRKVI